MNATSFKSNKKRCHLPTFTPYPDKQPILHATHAYPASLVLKSKIKSATTHEQIDPDFRFCLFTGHTVLELKSGSPLFGYMHLMLFHV